MKDNKIKEASHFGRYVQLRRRVSLNRMLGNSNLNYADEKIIITLEVRFPKWSEDYAKI